MNDTNTRNKGKLDNLLYCKGDVNVTGIVLSVPSIKFKSEMTSIIKGLGIREIDHIALNPIYNDYDRGKQKLVKIESILLFLVHNKNSSPSITKNVIKHNNENRGRRQLLLTGGQGGHVHEEYILSKEFKEEMSRLTLDGNVKPSKVKDIGDDTIYSLEVDFLSLCSLYLGINDNTDFSLMSCNPFMSDGITEYIFKFMKFSRASSIESSSGINYSDIDMRLFNDNRNRSRNR